MYGERRKEERIGRVGNRRGLLVLVASGRDGFYIACLISVCQTFLTFAVQFVELPAADLQSLGLTGTQ